MSDFLQNLGDKFLELRPKQNLIIEGNSNDYNSHIQAMLGTDNNMAVIYSASDAEYTLDLTKMSNKFLFAKWYNPRDNSYSKQKKLGKNLKIYKFNPPGESGPGNDWVLLLKTK